MARLDWTRDEIILAMDLYFRCGAAGGGSIPGKGSSEVQALSDELKSLSAHPVAIQGTKYRNPDGVYLKLTNLRAIETDGQHGMNAYSQLDAAVWREFVDDLPGLHLLATAVRQRVQDGALRPAVEAAQMTDVPIERQQTEVYMTTISATQRPSERKEQTLVLAYCGWLGSKGIATGRKRYLPAGEVQPLFSGRVGGLPQRSRRGEAFRLPRGTSQRHRPTVRLPPLPRPACTAGRPIAVQAER